MRTHTHTHGFSTGSAHRRPLSPGLAGRGFKHRQYTTGAATLWQPHFFRTVDAHPSEDDLEGVSLSSNQSTPDDGTGTIHCQPDLGGRKGQAAGSRLVVPACASNQRELDAGRLELPDLPERNHPAAPRRPRHAPVIPRPRPRLVRTAPRLRPRASPPSTCATESEVIRAIWCSGSASRHNPR